VKIIFCDSKFGKLVSYVNLMVAIFSVLYVHSKMHFFLGGRIYCIGDENTQK
jgi:hypothetical protein